MLNDLEVAPWRGLLGRASVQLLERLQLAFESCILSNSSSISFSIAEPLAALSIDAQHANRSSQSSDNANS